ncbi:MAG: type II toxin-antitoxin system VapC family toxin [Holophagales bacterium]|jgi:predicted nucleic acid-binding protein|nr:type II toxin-antitoxin system VapC family toxin [Holophagales bacterium]
MYLLDTMVLSELRKKERNPKVTAWLSGKPDEELFVSVVSIGEIAKGIAIQEKHDRAFAGTLRQWLEKLLLLYGERILPVDIPIAKMWGEITAKVQHLGADALIAATAIEQNLIVVTRNEKHFCLMKVKTINPWE